MQILHWPLTCPQASTREYGGSISPPLLEQRGRLSASTAPSIFPSSDTSQMSFSARRPSSNSFASSGQSTSDTALSEENDDNLPAYFILNGTTDQGQTMDTSNYTMENGETPIIATGNERNDPSGGDNNRPPGDHYSDDRRGRNRDNENQDNEEEDDETSASNTDLNMLNGNTEIKLEDAQDISRPMLIVNLYPPNRGYTFSCFVPKVDAEEEEEIFHESHIIPYSETYLLDCIDSETIPLRLLTKFDKYDGINLMCYQSNVLCEVRDFRRFPSATLTPSPLIRQVLLKPTNQSVLSDLDSLIEKSFEDRQMHKRIQQATALSMGKKVPINGDEDESPIPTKRIKLDNGRSTETLIDAASDDSLSLEQKLELEKEIIRETAPPLCLDPSKTVGLIANQAQYERLKWNSEDLKKSVVNSTKRREKIRRTMETNDEDDDLEDIYPGNEERKTFMPFYRFVKRKPQVRKTEKESVADLLKLPAISYTEFPLLLPPTELDDINKIGQPAEPATLRPMFSENYVKKIEEYILETERRKRPHTTRLLIYQRNGSESYFGELEQESFIEPNGFNNSSNSHTATTIRTAAFHQEGKSDVPSTKCQFELGSSRSVTLYVKQFTDIFTEDGRRPCKITYQKIGQTIPQVVYTNSYKSLTSINNNNNNNNNTSAVTNTKASSGAAGPTSPATSQLAAATITPPASVASTSTPVTIAMPVHTIMPVAGSGSPSGSTSQLPVQIVHPQPRSAQQQIQPIQIYTSVGTATMVSSPTTMTLTTNTSSSTATNVNFNLNVNSARIVRQQLLTRPQIINVNVQQQHPTQHLLTRQTTPQLIQSQLGQQQGIRIKQPTLATLLLTGLHPNSGSKPITVAIQPQPQNSVGASTNAGQMQTIQIGNTIDSHHGHTQHVVHHQTQQQHHQSTSSPIMIMVSPASANSQNTISIPSSSSGANQQVHGGSVSLNLNTISLDGLLSSVSNASNMSSYIATSVANSGNTVQMPMGLSNQINTLNILRLSNSNTVTLQPQQSHTALMRQGNISVMSHPARSGATQQTHTMMNMNTTGLILNQTPSNAHANINTQSQANANVNSVHVTSPAQHNTVGLNILQKTGAGQGRVQIQTAVQELEELSVPDLNSLLNVTSNGNSTFHNETGQSTTSSIDGRGLNLDLNLNLNLNLSGHTHQQGQSSASATASVSTGSDYDQNQSHTSNGSGESDGVDSFFNALSEAIGPELGQKLDGHGSSMVQSSHSQGMVSSSMSPSTPKSSSVITLNDLLGSPPMMVSSSTNKVPSAASPLQMQLQSPQSPSISSILSPISPNIMTVPVQSSLAYSTPRLSALLAGTPSADSINTLSSLVDSSTLSSTGGNRGGLPPSGPSYGNLLDRLAASRSQPQITHRTGGSLLSPIATATPSVVLEHPVLAATLTQGPNPNLHMRQGLTRPSYRQIAPAPAPQQQLINLLGLVSNPTNVNSSVGQTTIRINAGNPSPSANGNLGSR